MKKLLTLIVIISLLLLWALWPKCLCSKVYKSFNDTFKISNQIVKK